jgi:hypothetical protein
MPVVVVSPSNVVSFPEGGGHFWVYMQYVQGLRRLGCEVYWLERFQSSGNRSQDAQLLSTFYERMERYGLGGKTVLYQELGSTSQEGSRFEYIGISPGEAEQVFRHTDLLLNFFYSISPSLLSQFRRTALVDIDPGLLQFWIATGQLAVSPHDLYFTIGETVGTPAARFPDCGFTWHYVRPPVCLDLWPYHYDDRAEVFSTVFSWWGDEWIADGQTVYENNKRVTFMELAALASRIDQPLELAIYYGEGDAEDLHTLKQYGWRIRHSKEVTSTPEMYRTYIQSSRGEFSCAKPSCMKFQNGWISDRTLCYLASGKPVVVQHTGPSSFLPTGEGMFRFSTQDEALNALETINASYEKQCRAAREIVETHFQASSTLECILKTSRR